MSSFRATPRTSISSRPFRQTHPRRCTYIFACGPWLAKIFPELLANRISPSRQEIFFFGSPPGETNFAQPALPTWLYLKEEFYGMPDLESRGVKVADDRHGPRVDPDTQSRVASPEALAAAQKFVARRFPALKNAPIVETRVCQYENTSNGDFLIDRHPEFDNVWLVGGGSGHGFKHGPSLGEYVAARVTESSPAKNEIEPRFSLKQKQRTKTAQSTNFLADLKRERRGTACRARRRKASSVASDRERDIQRTDRTSVPTSNMSINLVGLRINGWRLRVASRRVFGQVGNPQLPNHREVVARALGVLEQNFISHRSGIL